MDWIEGNLENALDTWNRRMGDILDLITQGPEDFRGGGIWDVILNIHTAVQGVGLGLLVLFFAIGVVKTCGTFTEVKRPEVVIKLFIRFALARAAVVYGLELMMAVFAIVQGLIAQILDAEGMVGVNYAVLPGEIREAISSVGFLDRFFMWAVTLLGGLLILVLSIVMIMSVYSRFFKLYMFTAISPIPLASFAGESSSSMGKAFIKSYTAVCMEGAIIVLALVIFNAFASAPPVVDTTAVAATQVWSYIGELAFNMLVLVGMVKMADRLCREMLGL